MDVIGRLVLDHFNDAFSETDMCNRIRNVGNNPKTLSEAGTIAVRMQAQMQISDDKS